MASRLPQSLEAPRPGGRVGCLHPGEAAPAHRSPPPFLHLPGSGHFLSPSAHSHGPLRSRGRGEVRKWGEVTHFAEHLLQPARWAPLRAEDPGRRGARGASGAEPDARGGRRVPSPKELRSRAARGRVRGGGGGPRAQERLNCAKASALPARAPAGHRAAASPRPGGGAGKSGRKGPRAAVRCPSRDAPGLRPRRVQLAPREAGGAVRQQGRGARRGQRVTRLRPGPGPGDALCSGRASLRIVGRGRRPECERAEPRGTSRARRGRGSAPPGDARPCAAAAWTLGPERTRTGEWPARGRRGAGATGRGSVGRSRGSGPTPGRCALRAWEGRWSHTRGVVCPDIPKGLCVPSRG